MQPASNSPEETNATQADLAARAQAVLRENNLGESTKPAPNLYPHQWNWDSCFIAIGIATYDPERAAQELRSLLRGQWRNGMVPQIIFNPAEHGYFPGPDVWQCRRSPDAPRDVETSGITQPPVLATAARHVSEAIVDPGRKASFLHDIYPRILAYHAFLYRERDPDGEGLISVVHPWESGLDNSPPYLDAGSRVAMSYTPHYERLDLLHVSAKNRPTNKDYDLYVYLLEQMRAMNWDQAAYARNPPLAVQDVIFNAILCRANTDLAHMAGVIGADDSQPRAWFERTQQAINERLWDAERRMYYSADRVAGRLLLDDTIAGLLTLWGGVAPADRASAMIEAWLTPERLWPVEHPIPTTSMDSRWFNPENYWLGPVWVNTNWMVAQGLAGYGRQDPADRLRTSTLGLIDAQGFREYYHPRTGEGFGTDSFSWTAALALNWLSRPAPQVKTG